MHENEHTAPCSIPENLMLARLAQSEQMREFFIRMWLENPALAEQGGARVRALLSPLAAGSTPPGTMNEQRIAP